MPSGNPPIRLRSAVASLFLGAVLYCAAQNAPPSLDIHAFEKKIHQLVNEQRAKKGLPPLDWDEKLAAIARHHSRDMAANGFFDHTNLRDEDPEQRAARNGYVLGKQFTSIGENIFQIGRVRSIRTSVDSLGNETRDVRYRDTDQIAAETIGGWMESPGHRRNILSPNFDHEGIGAAVSESGKVEVTEMFIQTGSSKK